MSDAPPSVRSEPTPDGRGPAAPLTPDRIDAVLADFRGWLTDWPGGGREPPGPPPASVDLFTLVAQFTALRHEVNLQTKAARAATEQTAEALKQLAASSKPADPSEAVRPLVKALIDIADALMIGVRQTESARIAAEVLSADRPPEPDQATRVSLWGRLFGRPTRASDTRSPFEPGRADKLGRLLGGVADGYLMSLRRLERALAQAGVEPISVNGCPFDPELMEVVEVVGDDRPSGTVVEEVRRGYRWNGALLRYAQVKVAR